MGPAGQLVGPFSAPHHGLAAAPQAAHVHIGTVSPAGFGRPGVLSRLGAPPSSPPPPIATGAAQVSAAHVGTLQVGTAQIGTAQVDVAQVGAA